MQPPTPPIPEQPQRTANRPPPAWTQYKPPVQPPMYPPRAVPPVQRRESGVFVPTAVIVVLAIAAVVVMCASSVLGYAIGVTPIRSTPTGDTSSAQLTTQQPATLPTVTSTPAKGVVLTVSGNGSKDTAAFTVHDTWQLAWTCHGETHDLSIWVYPTAANSTVDGDEVDYTCPDNGGSDTSIYHYSGTFYFSVISNVTWDIIVTDLPN